jgi:uncharacterized protein YnzC (UPF0291/DUF896 family)
MKRILASILILMCLTSFGMAQEAGQQMMGQEQGTMPQGNMKGMGQGMGSHTMGGSMMYSMMINRIMMKANTLDLTQAQKKELADVNEKYVYPMVKKEADFRISHMKIMDMIHDPEFDPSKLKTEIKTLNQLNMEMADMMVDALSVVRKAIGPENFKQCMSMPMNWRMNSGTMMQKGQMMQNNQTQ